MQKLFTIQPTLKSDFIPEIKSNGMYTKDYSMILSIQVGEVTGRLEITYEIDYGLPSIDGERQCVVKTRLYGFDDALKVINIDLSQFVDDYTKNLPVYQETRKQQHIEKISKDWDKSWVHEFAATVKRMNIAGLTTKIDSKEEFLRKNETYNPSSVDMVLIYKNKMTRPTYTMELSKKYYTLSGNYEFNVNRDTRYGSDINLINAFIKRVDILNREAEEKQKNLNERNKKIQLNVENFSNLFGNCVHEEKQEYYNSGARYPRNTASYFIDSYYIVLKDKMVGDKKLVRRIKISQDSTGFYALGAIGYLTEDNVKSILDVINNQ